MEDVADNDPTSSAVLQVVSTPLGVATLAHIRTDLIDVSVAGTPFLLVTSPDQVDTAPTAALHTYQLTTDVPQRSEQLIIKTDTSSQIRYRMSASDGDVTLDGGTIGWWDRRGKN